MDNAPAGLVRTWLRYCPTVSTSSALSRRSSSSHRSSDAISSAYERPSTKFRPRPTSHTTVHRASRRSGDVASPLRLVPGMPMAVPTVGVPHPYPPTATQIPNLTLQQRIEQAQLSAALAHSLKLARSRTSWRSRRRLKTLALSGRLRPQAVRLT